MITNRHAYFGLLGGVVDATTINDTSKALGSMLRIDEWDEDGEHRFHIETEDARIDVFLEVTSGEIQQYVYLAGLMQQRPRLIFVPLVAFGDDIAEGVVEHHETRMQESGQHIVRVTHLIRSTGRRAMGVMATPVPVSIQNLRLLVPTKAS